MEKIFGQITVDNVTQGLKADKGVWQAQLRQVVTTNYPSVRVTNSNQLGGLFDPGAFNIENQSYTSTRIAWVPVPENTTMEQVQAALAAKPNARLYTIMSHNLEDVLTDEQKAAVSAGLTTMDTLREKHVVKDREGNVVQPVQYKSVNFSETAVEDVDLRPATASTTTKAPAATEEVVAIGA